MPIFIAALWGGFATVIASMVGRVLLALGVSYVTYKGLTAGTDFLLLEMKSHYSALGGEVGSFLSWLWVDKALSLVASSFAAAFAINTSAGAVTRMVIKK